MHILFFFMRKKKMTFPIVEFNDFQKIKDAFKKTEAKDFLELIKNKNLIPNKAGFYMFSSDKSKQDILYIGMSTCLRTRFTEYKYTGSSHQGRPSAGLIRMRQANYLESRKEQDRLYLTCVVYEGLNLEKKLREQFKPRYDIQSSGQIGKTINDFIKKYK